MPNNVAASMTASIVIDKSDLLAQILKGLSEGQKELENNKLEMYFDFSDSKNKAEFEKTLQKYKKQLASGDFVVKITNEGIEETVKSLDKLLDVVKSIASGKGFGTGSGNGNGIGNSIIDENQLKTVIDLFTKMESNLASIKKIFVDVGDGEEFSPLFSMINKINSSISELSSSVKGIGLNMNIDVGSDTELEAKIQSKMSNALQAYQRLFEHIKMSGVGGSMVNTDFFEFDINQFDTMMAKIQAYRKFIENMRNQVKSDFGGKDLLYTETDKKYWTSAASAMGQLTKVQNEMNKSADANPLDDLFGKTDLTGVIEQLNLIVSKLDEISVAATKFSDSFSQGFNVTTSVEEVAKLTEKVKELETELAKVKSVTTGSTETNISNGNTTPSKTNVADSSAESANVIQKENNALAETAENAEKAATSKKKFSQANKKVKETADESVSSIKDEANAFSQAEWDKNVKAIQDYMNAVSKLNNLKASDKGTSRKSNQIETQIKEVESLKDSAYEARQNLSSMINPHSVDIDTWEKFVQVMRQFSQASLGSAESVAKLEDALQNVKTSIVNSVQSSIDGYNKKLANLSATPADFNKSEKYKANLKELKEQISQFEAFRDQIASKDTITEEDLQSIAKYKSNIEDATRVITSMTAAEKGSTSLSRDKLYNKIGDYMKKNSGLSKQFRVELQKLQKQLTMRGANANVSDLTDEFLKLQIRIREAGEEGKKFWDVVKEKAWYGAASQIGMAFGVNDIIRYGQQAVSTITELDTALVDLKKTTSMSSSELENFYYDSNEIAKQMGVTTEEIINQASSWSRLGYSTKEASEQMAQLSSQFASISPGMDTDTAQEGLVSIMKAWDIGYQDVKSQIMDDINALGNAMAENNQDIVEGMERSAAALAAVGTSTEDAFALFSGIQEILQNAEKSGTSLRSVALRLRSFDESTEEYSSDLANITGELVDLTKTAEHAQGVSVFKEGSTTEFKSLVDYFREIADIWDEMSQKQQNDFLLKAFGRTQAQAGAALIQNFKGVEKALDVMDNAAGSSDREMSVIESSIEYKINALKETWVGTVQDILDRGDIGTIVDGLTKISEAISFVTSNLGILKTAALGVAGYLSFKNVGRDIMYSLFEYADNIHNLLWIQRFRVCYS
jgi:TP901 family phage tail tape measure protein